MRHILEIGEVWTVNGIVLGVVTFANFEALLKIGLLILTIVYTIIRIRSLWLTVRKQERRLEEEEEEDYNP